MMSQHREGGSVDPRYFRFSFSHLLISMLLLLVLVFIALFVQDSFIRPTLGDVLVVVWLYFVIASMVNLPSNIIACATVFLAFSVEVSQYLRLGPLLGLESGSPLSIILGATFDWMDLVAYSVGGVVCLLLGAKQQKTKAVIYE
ncbi:DUF2809 domain-containing protein [Photobacterium nomapromontoriensis]|uniref:ribosomal maturation YjgA family protein n=1 Tax=Photobacterium nomapromontoriensis TaxID=2910237 RepID=UPI003D0C282F